MGLFWIILEEAILIFVIFLEFTSLILAGNIMDLLFKKQQEKQLKVNYSKL